MELWSLINAHVLEVVIASVEVTLRRTRKTSLPSTELSSVRDMMKAVSTSPVSLLGGSTASRTVSLKSEPAEKAWRLAMGFYSNSRHHHSHKIRQ
jgi:hypothetical protein